MKRILYIILPFVIAGLFSCNDSKDDSVVEYNSTALHVALVPTMDNLPLYYAKETGIYDSLGLNIELLTYSSAMDCDTAFTNGEADGVVSDIVKANIWRSRGDSVKVVMRTDLNLFLMSTHSSRIKSVNNIKEKIMAITRNSALDYMADKVMEHIKLPLLQLNKPQINDIALRCKMTDQNQYDGAFLPEPYAMEAENNGAHRLISSSELIGNLSAVIFHDSIVSKRNDDIRKLVEGYDIAVNRLNALNERGDKDMIYTIKTKFISEIPDTILSYPVFKASSMPDAKIVSSTAEWANGRTLMKRTVSFGELVDSTFTKKK
ncbi:MAG: ABC transporter substrate-binding protein [Bacteroidaceae bacterium]|nr:ABC transporter substrate-binding protein [Bacteroidaceae bacterium]